ncbi:D-site 20S pre-rRNA nuclease Nob [Parasponia andersonii]|uniref:D-site 20S pre-rRNA nuclease Nob n=1 Tax=Parasponia andersonii TaxID=3476 RepID=A0A2P5CP66_PARAD|nr:D-site 20S pre-rRNA nuclease Nob [Parasponia andersonii]
MEETPNPSPAPCWSSVLKNQTAPKPQNPNPNATVCVFAQPCNSTKGIAVAVVDANAIIEGGDKLSQCADKFVSVPEVMDEVRDPVSRHRLAFVPFSVQTMEPTPESLNRVIKFARATGDLQTLSDVDIKLIALTYTLEAQIHGTVHLRDCPPPIHTVNVKRLPEKELPGWGSNVPNLEEWEALEHQGEDKSNDGSRILPLKDLNLNVISDSGSEYQQEDGEETDGRPKRIYPPKKEINIEGKKMVADGIDASQGEFDDDAGDWMPAVSRSTHRRFLRRKARREYYEAMSEKDGTSGKNGITGEDNGGQENGVAQGENGEKEGDTKEGKNDEESLSTILDQTRLKEDSLKGLQDGNGSTEGDHTDVISEGIDHLELSSEINISVDASNAEDDDSSEQSWTLRSLSESSVACITSDFAMQNVILQMGLRLLAPGGMQIRQLHRWVLRCHACYTVTAEIGRIFCPKCGNGGTLRKVAVTVGENGVVLAARRPRITLRGTKFSLPLPQGGRDAVTKNLILREDQLPQKLLYPKTRKKATKEGDEFFVSDDIFSHHHSDKRAPFQPPVRKALAVFSGKRNPNDNHYSRSKHK